VELVAVIEALAAALQAIDPAPGSRVGICARNTPEHLLALLATYAAGKVWVPLVGAWAGSRVDGPEAGAGRWR
jgi:acyl-CoA synthetase (AMP-forming)/AMP-acid ligase II